MKLIKQFCIVLVIFFSCSKQKTRDNSAPQSVKETPKVLESSESRLPILRTSNYRGNIIENLYKEALENNKDLQELNKQIEEITSDSLTNKTKDYLKYKNINSNYWKSAKTYTSYINDSISKTEMLNILSKLEDSYFKKIEHHEIKMDSINRLKSNLKDQLIIMKLFITLSMIDNYQTNELPDIKQLESMLEDFEKAIKDSKTYTSITK